MRAYYNEHEPDAAQWLRNLIAAGLIADGDVDGRSIEDVLPSDLAGYTQCHFFAGIGGWSAALRLAGWPDDRPVWTGSCPCQPFSAAGKGAAFADERHLWPAFHHLIAQCRPPIVFGEQVASPDGLQWIDLVHADMEAEGYAFGSADLCAAGIGAPHIRQRLYFVADADFRAGNKGRAKPGRRHHRGDAQPRAGLGGGGEFGDLANPGFQGLERRDERAMGRQRQTPERGCGVGDLANPVGERYDGEHSLLRTENGGRFSAQGVSEAAGGGEDYRPGPLHGFWRDADWLYCRDGKWRPVEPGTFPLADGIPASLGRGKSTLGGMARRNRIIRLRGYGNAIAPDLAAVFIRAFEWARSSP
jgi:DNA (cytosine-5)-methyltransferase 1